MDEGNYMAIDYELYDFNPARANLDSLHTNEKSVKENQRHTYNIFSI